MNAFLKSLNDRQKEAVVHGDGPMLVLAGAGSGKTRVLTHRIAQLIQSGVRPWNILAVTFTNKAAAEMRERVLEMTGEVGEAVHLSTFHSVCARMLRRDIVHLGYQSNFNIYDTDDQKKLMKVLIKDHNITREDMRPETVVKMYLRLIERAKLHPRTTEEICEFLEGEDFLAASVFQEYNKRMKQANALDFGDIINLTVRIWKENPWVLQTRQRQFQYLLVDEYQDTNSTQYEFIRLLSGRNRNVMVVGDDDQSIYGFRGADIENINRFVEDFTPEIVRLEQNYRSKRNILKVANSVICNNRDRMEKEMWTEDEDGDLVETLVGQEEYHEARLVRNHIQKLVRKGRRLSEIAIIYRTNASAIVFEKILREDGLPCVAIGSQKFYDRKEIKDVISYLKLLVNPRDVVSFERALTNPKRGIGPKSLQRIFAIAAAEKCSLIRALNSWAGSSTGKAKAAGRRFAEVISSVRKQALDNALPVEVFDSLLEESGYKASFEEVIAFHQKALQELVGQKKPRHISLEHKQSINEVQGRLDNIDVLRLELLHRFQEDLSTEQGEELQWLQEYLDSAMLQSAADKEDGKKTDSITMLTAHSAKGLEFPVVYVTGLSQHLFPHDLSLDAINGIEEERRLAYVAFTRAKEKLVLSRPERLTRMNPYDSDLERSMFWEEIDDQMFAPSSFGSKRRAYRQRSLWPSKSSSTQAKSFPQKKVSALQQFSTRKSPQYKEPMGPVVTREVTSLEELQPQRWIIHPSLGIGIIEARIEAGQDSLQGLKLKVHFKKRGSIILPMYSHCHLEIIET